MFDNCKLEGNELDAKVAELEGTPIFNPPAYSTDWAVAGPIIERDHIFIDPPTTYHVPGGPQSGWHTEDMWTATVSARTRQRPNPSGSEVCPLTVGRGAGATCLVAAMRAYVDSKATE